jgi:BNR repeat-like domain
VLVSGPSPIAAGCGVLATGTVFANAEVEPMIASAPSNPSLLVAAWQQDRASSGGARAVMSAVSSDGGRSWSRTLQPMSRCGGAAAGSATDFERATDPWVDVGIDGTLHLMALGFSGSSGQPGSVNAMLASRSTDNGRSWSTPTVLQRDGAEGFNDKNTLTADPTDGRYVYAVWDRLDNNNNGPTLFARSADAGQSWEPTRVIFTPTSSVGGANAASQTIANRIVVMKDGAERGLLVNVFTQIDNGSLARVRVQRSSDKGLSWSAPITVAELQAVGTRDPDGTLRVRDGADVPTVAVAPGGVIWLAWQDARFSGGVRDAIALSRSADGGRSWSAPVAVNREPTVAAFTPTLHVRADGRIGLMHYDLRSNTNSTSTLLADLWLLTSVDGLTWSETALRRGFDMSTAPSVTGGLFLGDYQGLASSGSSFVSLAVLPNADLNNRTDVFAIRVDGIATARETAASANVHAVRTALPTMSAEQRAGFSQRSAEYTRQVLLTRRVANGR